MPKMHIEKSISIKAPIEKVFNTLNDYNNWKAWSPWLIMEPEAKVTVENEGKSYSWEGNLVGSGEMKITSEDPNIALHMDLTFLKPWKSKAKVWFEFNEDDGGTKVTWLMDSSLPFFMFWMKKMMTAFVGMDYERGLNMLKDLIETGNVPSKLENEGISAFGGCQYVGIKTDCSIEDIGAKMSADLGVLGKWAEEHKDLIGDVPFSVYHKWDMVNRKVQYTSGIPLKEKVSEIPEGSFIGEIPAMKTYNIKHTGPYKHLGNAWSSGMMQMRGKVFKSSKKHHPFERYANDPMEVAENDLITEIHFPVK